MPTFTSVNPAPCRVGPPHTEFYRSHRNQANQNRRLSADVCRIGVRRVYWDDISSFAAFGKFAASHAPLRGPSSWACHRATSTRLSACQMGQARRRTTTRPRDWQYTTSILRKLFPRLKRASHSRVPELHLRVDHSRSAPHRGETAIDRTHPECPSTVRYN